ncbi:MAG: ImmA/IrrE family metallo-endopeptidase [Oscillospiraceae bacterium]|nr:ImmA/IrrE family metallo-endopeptidase [Oscillospiraceae bacterium]
MDVATMYLSRNDLEQIAQSVIMCYKYSCVPQHHLCYNVDPTELANLLGYKVEYAQLTQDGSILGQTATVPLWTTVINTNQGETYYYLDGQTILIEKKLLSNPRAIGRRNFTIAHELAHLLLNQKFPSVCDAQYRHCCFNRKIVKKEVSNWYEWQADALAAALLLPPDAIESAMFIFGLGSKMKVLSRKYSQNRYESFCSMAQFLGVSKTTLAYRMEQLGLLERNYLVEEAQQKRKVASYG